MALFDAGGDKWYAVFGDNEHILEMFQRYDNESWTWAKLKRVLYFYRCPVCHNNDTHLAAPKGDIHLPKVCNICSEQIVLERVKYCPRWRWRG